MDIEELRARAMASMPPKIRKKSLEEDCQVSSEELPLGAAAGRIPSANKLFDTNFVQLPEVSTTSFPSFSGSHKETDVILSNTQAHHSHARSPAVEKKDDNLVIRFSDGESDSDAEEQNWKKDERLGKGNSGGNTACVAPNQSNSAFLQATTALQRAPRMRNRMAMMQKQLVAIRTTVSNTIHARNMNSGVPGEGLSRRSSHNHKHIVGQKISVSQKHGVNTCAPGTKPSGSDLENLRQQIATKENELKLQRNIRSGQGQEKISLPSRKLHSSDVAISTSVNTGGKLSANPASSKLMAAASDKKSSQNELEVPKEPVPASSFVCLKTVNSNNLQQQGGLVSNSNIEYDGVKSRSNNEDPMKELHLTGSKRPFVEDDLIGKRFPRLAISVNENETAATHLVPDSDKKCLAEVNGSISAALLTPFISSKRKISADYQHTNICQSVDREGNKKCRLNGLATESGDGVISSQRHSSIQDISLGQQEHCSVKGIENKADCEKLQATSKLKDFIEREDCCMSKVQMGFEEIQRGNLNKSNEAMQCEDCVRNISSGVAQTLDNCMINTKEVVCLGKTVPVTSGGVPTEALEDVQKTGSEIIDTSRAVVGWQGARGSLQKARSTDIYAWHDFLKHGSIIMQTLMKEEELADKELEEAQEHRCRCEIEERLAWRAYRKSQEAVQAANKRCAYLHQKRELLCAQVQAVGMRDYSSKGSPGRPQQSRDGCPPPHSFQDRSDLNILASDNLVWRDHQGALKQTGDKLDEHRLGMDYAVMSSLHPCIGDDLYLSKHIFQSAPNNRLLFVDPVPDPSEELCVANKIIDQDKILDSASPREDLGQDQETALCEPEVLHAGSARFHSSRGQSKMKGELALSEELALETSEAVSKAPIFQTSHMHNSSLQHLSRSETSLQKEFFHLSGNIKSCMPSNLGLRREDLVFNRMKGTPGENGGGHELISRFYCPSENLSDERKTTNLTCGISSVNFSLADNEASNLNLERAIRAVGNGDSSRVQHEEQQQNSSIIPPKIVDFWCPGRNEDTPFAIRDLLSGSVDEVHNGLKGHHFLSTSNEDAENLEMDEAGGSGSKHDNPRGTMNTLLNKSSNQNRAPAYQISASESAINSQAKFSRAVASKQQLCSDSVSLTDKSTDKSKDGTATPSAETSTESLHGQNYDHEYNIQFSGGAKHESFVCERFQELPAMKTNAGHLKNIIGQGIQEDSAGTCHSDNSFASNLECEKISDKGLDTILPSMKFTRDSFEELNEEKSHSGSVDEGGIGEKENTVVWKSSIEGMKSDNLSKHVGFQHRGQLDFAVVADLTGKSITSGSAHMENEDYNLGFLNACFLRHDDAEKTFQEGFTSRQIEGMNDGFSEEANNRSTKSNFGMLSSKLKIAFNYANILFSNRHGILANASGDKTQLVSQDSPQYVSKFLCCGSPLDIFKSYRKYSYLNGANSVPNDSNTGCHAIDPFWPLCKFEHRGKCNNEDCIWQHVKDYNLTPSQILEQLNKYSNADVNCSTGDHKELKISANHEPLESFEEKAKQAICRASKIHCAVAVAHSEASQGLSHHSVFSYRLQVPIYRIGSHLIKSDNSIAGSLVAWSSRHFWKLGFCQHFSIPFAIQRLLPSDMPCLRSSAVREWMLGNNNRLPTCLYTSSAIGKQDDMTKCLFRGLGDVEHWLELAIDSMNFDSSIEKSDGRKKALCILSRAVEINPNSVALWVVYLHIFYWKERVIGKDDMFCHAVQHNKGSYELWLLFINSRLQLAQRLEAYQLAITELCHKACAEERHNKSVSSSLLDLVLQMLNFLCMSDCKHRAVSWIDELLYSSTNGFDKRQSDYISVSNLLTCLTKHDVCVLWVSCTYLIVYGRLPEPVVERLEFAQELPFDVNWCSCELTEASRVHALKLMHTAVSSLREYLDAGTPEVCHSDKDALLSMHALAVNHIKCVAAIEGLPSARSLSCQYKNLHPTCIELILLSSCIEAQYGGDKAGLAVFEEALCNWPEDKPGIQCIWNQIAAYALKSKGIDFAKDLMNQWAHSMQQHKGQGGIAPCGDAGSLMHSSLKHAMGKQGFEESMDKSKQADNCFAHMLGTKAHYFCGSINTDRSHWSQEGMFGLLNLAMHRLLNNDPSGAQAASHTALKAALYDEDVKHCIRENAALTFIAFPDGSEPRKNGFETRLLSLLDKCFVESRLFPVSKPLSRAFCDSIKKPKLQLFIDNLLGPIPVDCSFLNSILEICYGPSLLPKELDTLKDLVDFIEGLLELAPANVKLALSVCRLISQRYDSHSVSSIAACHWASSLLFNALFQSFPVAPENTWLEVGNFLGNLGLDIILEEFYQQALSVHPFSVALWRSSLRFHHDAENCAGAIEAAKQRGLIID